MEVSRGSLRLGRHRGRARATAGGAGPGSHDVEFRAAGDSWWRAGDFEAAGQIMIPQSHRRSRPIARAHAPPEFVPCGGGGPGICRYDPSHD